MIKTTTVEEKYKISTSGLLRIISLNMRILNYKFFKKNHSAVLIEYLRNLLQYRNIFLYNFKNLLDQDVFQNEICFQRFELNKSLSFSFKAFQTCLCAVA
jgi:hypothetical protein